MADPSRQATDLGSLLTTILTQRKWQRRLRLHQIFLFWDEVVGKEIALHAQPQTIRGEVLWVAVTDSVWMQQLQFEKVHLMELLNARLGEGGRGAVNNAREPEMGPVGIVDLKFQLDPTLNRRRATAEPIPPLPTIDPEAFASFTASLNSLPDRELRESMKRVWLANQRGRKG